MTNGGEKVVEVKQLPLTPDDFRDIRAVLSDALRAMAYSLRGNNDVAYKILLLLYQEDLDRVAKPQQTEIFHLAQDLAQPYWDEFGYDRRGYERFQIWIEAGRPKATPTFLLDRFWRWGEDGTVNRTFGEVEYNALLAASAGALRCSPLPDAALLQWLHNSLEGRAIPLLGRRATSRKRCRSTVLSVARSAIHAQVLSGRRAAGAAACGHRS